MSQQRIAEEAGVEPSIVSQMVLARDETMQFRHVLVVVDVLGLDVELRPRSSMFTPRPSTRVNELGVSPAALSALSNAGIHAVGELGSARVLLEHPELSGGVELFEVVCALNRYGLSLRRRVPGDRDREIFRLRIVEGLTLKQLAERFGLHRERIRQILWDYFGLTGIPPAARRRTRE